ncbi:MAG: type II toxin-antitoxin system VapB family antitoxin [Propionibacteriaceae bacterium]|nr:type II toxin-antitoxin system VapB family antitoxin [Propionibacteriaceae bacterium]
MAINIKNERTVEAVKQLAAFYGMSYTAAIEKAAQDTLRNPRTDQRLAQILEIADAYRNQAKSEIGSDHDLYDENGLYR